MFFSFRSKLFALSVVLITGFLAITGVYLHQVLKGWTESRIEEELQIRSELVASALHHLDEKRSSEELLASLSKGTSQRITLIDLSGQVLADTHLTAEELQEVENHAERPEFQAALTGGFGRARRHSSLVDTDMLYTAVLADNAGPVVRLAVPLRDVDQVLYHLRLLLIIGGFFGLGVAIFMSSFASSMMSKTLQNVLARNRIEESASKPQAQSLSEITEALDETMARLRRMETIRQDFVANVSHELRTPVAIIQANAETLLDGALDSPEHARTFTEGIHRNSERLTRLISDLLDISRIEAGQRKFDLTDVDLHSAAERAAADALTHTSLTPTLQYAIPRELRVLADPGALDQILINLLDNAVKYGSSQGSVENSTIVFSAELKQEMVLIEVRDEGPGIDSAHHERLFERFYRVDEGRSTHMGGTGLGLSIAKHLVTSMGGALGFRERDDRQGSIFWFTLPRA